MIQHTMTTYQKQKPFASFLSGIAGTMGIPLWAFFVNRGQLIAGFGVRDKNGAIMEFFPANNAYHYVSKIGFRTFVKINGNVHECFLESNTNQTLTVRQDQVSIEEINESLGFSIKVTYFTLPNSTVASLIRKVTIKNLDNKPQDIQVIDGLAQILPSGIDYGSYKAVSNLLQSWMDNVHESNHVFYKLRASTGDSAEVSQVLDGNFYHTASDQEPFYISDYKLIFNEDTSLETPYGFIDHDLESLKQIPQTHVNQVPCAMSGFDFKALDETTWMSMIGYAKNKDILTAYLSNIDLTWLLKKEEENLALHDTLVQAIETKTAHPLLNDYFKQCYLDNVLRGGTPLFFKTLDGPIGYHIYSRKHGDLERDYNFFSIEPAYYSQGNGNFRDVLQNRRNDLYFHPELGDFNIYQFISLIQADGYNPLSIEGIQFTYGDALDKQPAVLHDLLKRPFTPGEIATVLDHHHLPIESTLRDVLSESHVLVKANFGEGYWEDHFTYHYDQIETYLSIYPDHEEEIFFKKTFPFFVSPVKVLPRDQKYVKTPDGKIRQYGAIRHEHNRSSGWLKNSDGLLKVNLFGKLLTLVLNKYGHLDPYGIGLSYEGEKPGWNDAMNGVPGLFGSGVSETIELKKIVKLLKAMLKKYPLQKVSLLDATDALSHHYTSIYASDALGLWNQRMTALEKYRDRLEQPLTMIVNQADHYSPVLDQIDKALDQAIKKAFEIDPVLPTYLIYEVTDYEDILDHQGHPVIGNYGLPVVRVKSFDLKPLPIFLEAPARYLKGLADKETAQIIYNKVKETGLYDRPLKFYQTSVSLDGFGHEIGRIRAFTPGWLERESNFLHMTYKYLLGLLKAGLYDQFYAEIQTNFTCFMDPKIYGRPPIENSSFLATSSNPDPKKHGQGFVSRLTGSTAEVLSMWRHMFFGDTLFSDQDGQLVFSVAPKLSKDMFENGQVEVTLFGKTKIVYHNPDGIDTYDPKASIEKMILIKDNESTEIQGSTITGKWTRDIREGYVDKINVYVRGGK